MVLFRITLKLFRVTENYSRTSEIKTTASEQSSVQFCTEFCQIVEIDHQVFPPYLLQDCSEEIVLPNTYLGKITGNRDQVHPISFKIAT